MRVLTIFGTRPEIIRLSRVIPAIDAVCDQVLAFTGQNYDERLADLFFRELDVRSPDYRLDVRSAGFGPQCAQVIERSAALFAEVRPDRVLILGDTNSGLAAIPAARMGIPVFHMEAGNRCYDNRVPEEINRRLIDHSSAVLMPYTSRSSENLVREGIERRRIFVTGNPIYEVLQSYSERIGDSRVLERLGLRTGEFMLLSLHRAETVDTRRPLASVLCALDQLAAEYDLPVIYPVHPHAAAKMQQFGLAPRSARVRMLEPLGLFDFVALERHARCVLTDSGTVQEECCIFHVPNVTLRDATERPETIECGSSILAGTRSDSILRAIHAALTLPVGWAPPAEYLAPHVSRTVANVVAGTLPFA